MKTEIISALPTETYKGGTDEKNLGSGVALFTNEKLG